MKLLHKSTLRPIACTIIAVLTIGAWLPQADAKTYQVKNLNNSGNGSLRDALTKLNTSNDPSNTVNFQSGLDGVINLNSTLPQINKSVSINGPGAGEITIVGYNGGIFNVFSGVVSISGLTLQGKGCDGSGILRNQFAVLTVGECVITSKGSTDQVGILNENGATTVVNASSVVKNRTSGNGGGIVNQGSLNLINSTIASNKAVKGGAIFNDAFSTLSMINCTIADNTASNSGGGIFNSEGGTATLGNTIVGRNFKTNTQANDVAGAFTSLGDNLIGSTTGSTGFGVSDIRNIAANLLRLAATIAENDGPTPTLALLSGSPATNAGSNALALDENGEALTFDQRGAPYVRIAGGTVDIGAYESNIPSQLENARAYKQRALMTISACLESSDSCNSYYLNRAADRISASLESWLWIDGDRLSHYGVFVFIREQQAVWYLKRVNGSCAEAAQAAMNDLVYADEKIAAAALNSSAACSGYLYSQAQNAYAHGVAAAAAGDEFSAISWYGWTWWFANNALGKPCHYDDDDEDYCYHGYNN